MSDMIDRDAAIALLINAAKEIEDDEADNRTWGGPDPRGKNAEMLQLAKAANFRALADALRAIPAVQVGVKPGEIERAVWAAMGWTLRHAKQLQGDIIPAYTESGNSDAETECRATAARIRAVLTVASGPQDATFAAQSCMSAQPSPDVAGLEAAVNELLQIRAVWADPHNDEICGKVRAALARVKGGEA